METGIRRFILRLMVGVLAFVIGVGAAMLFTGFRPFERFSNSPSYRHGHCGAYYRSWSPPPPSFETVRGDDLVVYPSCPAKMRARLDEMPPTPPADSPEKLGMHGYKIK
jgi:hypothetical protein